MDGNGSRDGQFEIENDLGGFSFLSIDPTPHHQVGSGSQDDDLRSPGTPHPGRHGRQLSESRQLLPESTKLFEYSATTRFTFGDEYIRGTRFPNWSDEPVMLKSERGKRLKDFTADIVLVMVPLVFFALASVMIRFDGNKPEGNQETWFRQTTWVAATLFPLVFSLILGHLAVKIASYKLERGANLVLLERLMGSQSFFSTMKTQAGLGPLKPLAVCLITVWLLSPFGSQAMLRSLSVDLVHESGVTVISYFNARQPASIDARSWFPAFISSFTASILSSPAAKNDSSDLWGNARVPLLSSLRNFTSEDSEGWLPVNEGNFQYSSLFGIPIFLPDVNITTLPLKSSYIQLFCHDLTSNVTRKGNTFSNPGLLSPSGPFFTTSTVTATTSWALGYLGLDTTSLLSPSQNSTPSLDAIADKIQRSKSYNGLLLYEDFTGLQNVTSIYCTPVQVYVESEVSCLNSKCRVTKIRESKEDHPSGELTLLGFRSLFLAISTVLGNNTPHLGTRSRGSVDMLQNYLSNPLNNTFIRTAMPTFLQNQESRLLNTSLIDFGNRLSSVMNAVLQSSQGFSSSTSSGIMTTTARTTTLRDKFVVHWPWLSILLLSSTTLFFAALASLIIRRQILAPDYLGFVSSLLRESPEIEVPVGGAGISALERSRRLKSMRVKLGETGVVRSGWMVGVGAAVGVGKIGLGREEGVRRLERGRLYV